MPKPPTFLVQKRSILVQKNHTKNAFVAKSNRRIN